MRKIATACTLALALACSSSDRTAGACPLWASHCGVSCSSLATDASNCGACGHACPAGDACNAGVCGAPSLSCTGGTQSCGGVCTDLSTSRVDCGWCGHVCAVNEDCAAGTCTIRCQADLALCGASCVNLATDAQHCGSCSTVCGTGVACIGGVCGGAPDCAAGLSPCNGTCVDTTSSATSCGACGVACAVGQACISGTCQCITGTLCGTACVDPTTDPANCGACGHACASGACASSACVPVCTVCTGTAGCVDLSSDLQNCGGCGVACPAGDVCVAGMCAAGGSAFRMLGGDAGHSGVNPDESGTPPLTLAWTSAGSGGKGPAVIEGGRVFTLGGSRLYAHQATTGTELWSYNFGTILGGIGWPAVSDGHVYVATSNNWGDTWLRAFDAATGAVEFKVGFGSQWERYWSPIVVDGIVYLDGGTYGGLYGFDATQDGHQLFFTSLEQYDEWSPAWFGTTVYSFVTGRVRAHDRLTGAVRSTLDVGWTWVGYDMQTATVFGDRYGYVISPPNLFAFEPLGPGSTALHQVWTANDAYTAYPAFSSGTVYALSNGNLHALDATTGARQWVFTGDDHLAYPPVIAGGYVYVASASNVYALSEATHLQVWTAPTGGRLAIGAGMLVVSRESDGALFGYRLTR